MLIPTVIEGDYKGSEVRIEWGGVAYIKAKGKEKVFLDSSTVKSYDILETNEKKSFSSGVTRGIVGGAVLGGVGALAGVNSAKSINSAKIKIQFKNGKCSLLLADKNVCDCIINKCFNLESEEPVVTITNNKASKFCTNCGCQLSPEVKFCPSCGLKVDSIISNNNSNNTIIIEETNVEKTQFIERDPNVDIKAELKEELKSTYSSVKESFSDKNEKNIYSPKRIKLNFIIAFLVAAILSLILVVAMHTKGEGIGTDVIMFIFCTIVFSIPILLGTLLICLPSIKKNRKEKKDNH